MDFPMRRVVTGHDEEGRSLVQFDGKCGGVVSKREGHESFVVWTSVGHPADNSGSEDTATLEVATTLKDGSIFRIMRLSPGVKPRWHRSDSIDYLVVLSGRVSMELDIGRVELRAGDTLVQRGTMHNWIVDEDEPCVMAVVLLDADPVSIGNKRISAVG